MFGRALERMIGDREVAERVETVSFAVDGGWAEYRTSIAFRGATFGEVDRNAMVRRYVELDGALVKAAADLIAPG